MRLSSLPRTLHGDMLDRLVRGDSVHDVGRWLMAQPDRGGLQNVHELTLFKYLYALSDVVKRQKRERPAATMAELKAEVRAVRYDPENLPAPVLWRRGPRYQSVESFVGGRVEKRNRNLMLLGLFEHNWAQLERLRMIEEEYHHDKKLPTQAMCQARAQIGQQLKWIMAELRENDALELVRQKTMVSLGEFEGRTPDKNRINASAREREAAETNVYAALDATDRLLLRSFAEKAVIACDLTKRLHEQQSQPATPATPGVPG